MTQPVAALRAYASGYVTKAKDRQDKQDQKEERKK